MSLKINTTLNGAPFQFDAEIETTALEVIRGKAKLTGTKFVCGTGACGACTVLVDGEALCSCLLPALQLEGKSVQTVEAHDAQGLHPVQKAFLANDALQCGFCTPGFINEAIAFYNEWNPTSAGQRPTREQVAEAMSGHYCRCGAYQGIYEAVIDACSGKYDVEKLADWPRNDGLQKVTGKAKYTVDIQLPGQLTGKILRSKHPHARIKSLDISPAQNMDGVKAVIRYKKDDIVSYEGEPIVILAAENRRVAQEALDAIVIEYEPLPHVLTISDAKKVDAPLVFGHDRKNMSAASEAPPFPGKFSGNVRKTSISLSSSNSGKAERLVAKASMHKNHFTAIFQTPTQFHTCLEPHCAVADWKTDGSLTMYASTQGVYFLAKDLAKHFGLDEENVKVYGEFVGGGFGSKLTMHTEMKVAAELSRAANAPVSVVYSRAEEFTETGYRPSAETEISITADEDGSNAAYKMDAFADSGCAMGSNIADISGLGYTGISKSLQDYDVLTNRQPGAAFRGPGGPAACFALEQAIDQLAFQLKMDPITFRRKWEKHEGYIQLMDWVERLPLWKDRPTLGLDKNGNGRGVGVSFGAWMHIFMPTTVVEVEAGPDGLVVRNSVQDMGQGARSVLSQAVADVFKYPSSKVKVEIGDSDYPMGPTSGGSRTTASIYPAAFEAATQVLKEILAQLSKKQGLVDPKVTDGGIAHASGKLTWNEAFATITPIKAKATRGHNDGFNPMGLIPLSQNMELGQNRAYGVYVLEVEVNGKLGHTRVTQAHGAMRVGKVHVRELAESQCQGGVIQGIGHVLYEDRATCPTTGLLLTRGLEDYRLPGIGDMPTVHIDFIEEGFDMVKQKGIGLAELCTTPVAGAVGNAIFNATGYRPLVAPITPERLIAGLKPILEKNR